MKQKSISLILLAGSLVTGLNIINIDSAFAAAETSCLVPTGFFGSFFAPNPGTAVGNYLFDQGEDKEVFKTNCNITDIGIVEGRAGVAGAGDYEVGIGLNGAQADLSDQLELDWVDEVLYDWTLDWDATTNVATFSIVGGDTIDYTFTGALDTFNAFGIQTRADDPSSFITEGTTMTIDVNSITFNPDPADLDPLVAGTPVTDNTLNLSVTATSSLASNNIEHQFYTLNAGAADLNSSFSEMTSMSGTFSLDIPDGGVNPQDESARSRIGFQILMFDPPVTSTPEPASILSLMALTTLGLTSLKRRHLK